MKFASSLSKLFSGMTKSERLLRNGEFCDNIDIRTFSVHIRRTYKEYTLIKGRMAVEYTHIKHPFAPIYDENSRILILGSLPSVLSRENSFYYGNPRNRFWNVLSEIFHRDVPDSVEGKTEFLLSMSIALWDVIAECDIEGSNDSSIRNTVANDIRPILRAAKIERIFTNGGTAHRLYSRFILPITGIQAVKLPSTSPANAAWSFEKLTGTWRILDNYV